VPYADTPGVETVLDLFPSGTIPVSVTDPDPLSKAVLISGPNALEYSRRRGYAFGLAIQQVQQSVTDIQRSITSVQNDIDDMRKSLGALDKLESLIGQLKAALNEIEV
jgi:hypothetical protein